MNGKDIDAKIDELAQMVARGFSEVHQEIGEIHQEIGEMHQEIGGLRGEIADVKEELTGQMRALEHNVDLMLDKHIGMFRKDYDELAARVKDLELAA